MSGSATIASLNIAVLLQFQKMEAQFRDLQKKVGQQSQQVAQSSGKGAKEMEGNYTKAFQSMTKAGAKFALGMMGAESALKLVAGLTKDVFKNADQMKFLDKDTVDNIARADLAIQKLKEKAQGFLGNVIAGLAKLGSGASEVINGKAANLTADDRARAFNPNFDKDLEEARKKFSDAQRERAIASLSESDKWKEYQYQAAQLQRQATDATLDQVKALEKMTEAQAALAKADDIERGVKEKLKEARKEFTEETERGARSLMSDSVATSTLRATIEAYRMELRKLAKEQGSLSGSKKLENMVQQTESLEKAIKLQAELNKRYEEIRKNADEVGDVMSSSFENAVFEGGKLRDMLNALGMDLAKLVFRQTITQPLANLIGSGISSLFGVPGRASGGPVDGLTLVGENGPELFDPRTSTIIPSGQTAKMIREGGGGPSFSFSYNIAAGVSRQELIPALAASNKAVVAQITDMMARGGRRAQMLGA